MDNAYYTTLSRQSGLMRQMQSVANNIANMSTTGFRREGIIFSEYVHDTGPAQKSLSMAGSQARHVDLDQGTLDQTGGQFDFAIDGPGFFLIDTPEGERLTRAGHFTPNEQGDLVTPDGYLVLDAGGAPVFVPPDTRSIAMSADGTLSADGRPIGQLGVWQPVDPKTLEHQAGTRFSAGEVEPVIEGTRIRQGFLEDSNVNPVSEITRMIEVSRAYELGQSFLEKEDERIRAVVSTLGRQ
ncbi:MAG: flagellar hook-basal body complex protein [Tropicimonas sp.]|uniref:flagellar hook-basal body complex protein n=1 Tax=Tropicimonas sp. TaxID=2067044 RepID=UPI003A8ACAFF